MCSATCIVTFFFIKWLQISNTSQIFDFSYVLGTMN